MVSDVKHLHIVVMRAGGIVVVRERAAATFRDLQERYPDYMTSLGPLEAEGVLDVFETEWPDLFVTNKDAINSFVAGDALAPPRELYIKG